MKSVFKTIKDKYLDAKYWILHRTINRYNKIEIPSLAPGYYDKDTQMLHGMFDLLVDYVECELGWMQLFFSKTEKKNVPWWQTFKSYRNKHTRRLGIKHLNWKIKLSDGSSNNKNGYQAQTAKEQKELYLWWKDIRPKRKNPYSAPDYNSTRWKQAWDISEGYYKEDTKMLVRLVKIRQHLWT